MLRFTNLNLTLRIVNSITNLITCCNLAISNNIAHDLILWGELYFLGFDKFILGLNSHCNFVYFIFFIGSVIVILEEDNVLTLIKLAYDTTMIMITVDVASVLELLFLPFFF
jgi:hypothetical protein